MNLGISIIYFGKPWISFLQKVSPDPNLRIEHMQGMPVNEDKSAHGKSVGNTDKTIVKIIGIFQ
jgi:hypothetical protein